MPSSPRYSVLTFWHRQTEASRTFTFTQIRTILRMCCFTDRRVLIQLSTQHIFIGSLYIIDSILVLNAYDGHHLSRLWSRNRIIIPDVPFFIDTPTHSGSSHIRPCVFILLHGITLKIPYNRISSLFKHLLIQVRSYLTIMFCKKSSPRWNSPTSAFPIKSPY